MPVDPKTYLLVHVLLSLVGIFSGLVVVGGLIAGVRFSRWVGLFLATTLLTSLTGFGFPFVALLPSHIVGALSLVVLLGALAAVYWKHLEGGWRRAFVVLSVVALYLNVFVLLAQLLQKTPALALLAPTPAAPAFAAAQGLVLALFAVLGWAAVKGYGRGAGSR
ncbi:MULTISPECIES: hypothetical protein [unclassified Methylibium]|uniref:hypothetical protein n=1 Tax=unclassified Methylibium TaxID=2633235 RepID=UPI0003F46160|nr:MULTISPECIES: hypothetical protein [unclassified Methylibium]EWS53669.1 hypothetical protein X551_03546 [Methylibium sp. T29]EWS58063.1 hypothetical protein Y694_04033 [Methylibium sp. T29-B]